MPAYSYLKELHMEQPGDYCITYNGALVQKAMAVPWRKPR
jgi:hydroxymethylpyrimidine pyrophosphatase-like HAD family hydrolase